MTNTEKIKWIIKKTLTDLGRIKMGYKKGIYELKRVLRFF